MEDRHKFSQVQESQHSIEEATPDPVALEKRRRLLHNAKYWLGAGVLLMGISFGTTLFFSGNGVSFVTTCMYILTTLGTACVLKSLVNVFN